MFFISILDGLLDRIWGFIGVVMFSVVRLFHDFMAVAPLLVTTTNWSRFMDSFRIHPLIFLMCYLYFVFLR